MKDVFFSHGEPQACMADAVAGQPLWSRHGDVNAYGAQTANGFQEFRPSDRLCVPPNVPREGPAVGRDSFLCTSDAEFPLPSVAGWRRAHQELMPQNLRQNNAAPRHDPPVPDHADAANEGADVHPYCVRQFAMPPGTFLEAFRPGRVEQLICEPADVPRTRDLRRKRDRIKRVLSSIGKPGNTTYFNCEGWALVDQVCEVAQVKLNELIGAVWHDGNASIEVADLVKRDTGLRRHHLVRMVGPGFENIPRCVTLPAHLGDDDPRDTRTQRKNTAKAPCIHSRRRVRYVQVSGEGKVLGAGIGVGTYILFKLNSGVAPHMPSSFFAPTDRDEIRTW